MSDRPQPERSRRRHPRWRRFLRRCVWAGLALLLLALLALWLALPRLDGWARTEAERAIAEALGAEAEIGRLTIDPVFLTVEFGDVRIEAHEDGRRMLGVFVADGRIDLSWKNLLPLRRGRIRLRNVRVDRPDIAIDAAWSPPAGGEASDVSIQIDQLSVSEGRLRYEDRTVPLEGTLHGLAVDALLTSDRQSLGGFASWKVEVEMPTLRSPARVDVVTRFHLSPDAIHWFDLQAEAEGLSLAGDGHWRWARPMVWQADQTVTVDLARLSGWVDLGDPAVAGRLEARVRADGPSEIAPGADVEARLDGVGLRWSGLTASRFSAEAGNGPDGWSIEDLRVDALGGVLTGAGSISTGTGSFALALEGSAIRADSLFRAVRVPLPLSGRARAQIDLAGSFRSVADLRLDATVAVEPEERGDMLPVEGAGTVTLADAVLRVDVPGARTGRTTVDVDVTADLLGREGGTRVVLTGETEDVGWTRDGTLKVLEGLGVTLPEFMKTPVTGRGPLRAEIQGDGAFDLTVDLRDGALDGVGFDRLQVETGMAGPVLDLRRVEAEAGSQRLNVSATIDTQRGRLDALDAEATQLQVEPFAVRLIERAGWRARVDGSASLRRVEQRLQGEVMWEAGELSLEGLTFDSWTAAGQVDGGVARLTGTRLEGTGASIEATAVIAIDEGSGTVSISRGDLALDAFPALAGQGLQGRLEASGDVRFDPSGIEMDLALASPSLGWEHQPLGAAAGHLRGDTTNLSAELGATDGRWRLESAIALGDQPSLELQAEADDLVLDLTPFAPEAASVRLGGQLSWSGPFEDALRQGAGQGVFPTVEIRIGPRTFRTDGALRLSVAEGVVGIPQVDLIALGERLTTRLRFDLVEDDLDFAAVGLVDAANVSLWVPQMRASGQLELDVRARGPLIEPELSGFVRLSEGRLRLLTLTQRLEQLEVELELKGDRAEIRRAEALLGGGAVTGSGFIELGSPIDYSFGVRLDGARLRYAGFEGGYTGRLTFAGGETDATLSGDIELDYGRYAEDFDLVGSLGRGVREYSASDGGEVDFEVSLDVNVRADQNVWIRNDLARLEARVNFDVGGTIKRPELSGNILLLEGGEVEFQDVVYRIEVGSIDFTDPSRINPYLRLRARTQVAQYDILLTLDGTQDDFTFDLTSTPALSQQDIIALLATGSTLSELNQSGGGEAFTGDLVSSYFAGTLSRQLEQVLPFERIQIDPLVLQDGGDTSARITVGKKVADELFVLISQDIGENEAQTYQVEWRASRNVRVLVQNDSENGIGGDLRYIDRFWLRPPPRRTTPTEEGFAEFGPEAPLPIVREVRWAGVDGPLKQQLVETFRLAPGEPFDRQALYRAVNRLRRELVASGRIESSVRARARPVASEAGETGQERVDVDVTVTAGRQVEVVIEGVRKKDEKRLRERLASLWIDGLFEEDLYIDSIRLIKSTFHDRGYYAADVTLQDEQDAETPLLRFIVDRGKPVSIAEVTVTGNGGLTVDRVKRQMLSKPSDFFSKRLLKPDVIADDVRAIRNLYRDEGYLDAEVPDPRIRLSAESDRARIAVRIVPGNRYRIGELEFEHADLPVDRQQLLDWARLDAGDVYSRSRLAEAEGRIRAGLDRMGRPDARVRAEVERRETDVAVRVRINGVDAYEVGDIVIAGNRVTKERVIRRRLAMTEGQLLSRTDLLETQRRLYQLGVFSSVRIRHEPIEGQPGRRRVFIQVDESPPLGFSVSGGYDSEGGLRGGLGVNHENVGGTDRTVGLQVFGSGIRRRAQVVATDPLPGGKPWPLQVQLGVEEEEEVGFDVARENLSFRVDRVLSRRWSGYSRLNFQEVDLSEISDELAAREEKVDDVTLGDLGVVAVYEGRDDPFLTLSGQYFTAESRWFTDALFSEANFLRNFAQYAYYQQLPRGMSFATSVRVGAAFPYGGTQIVPISERFFAGGDSTLRAFPRDEVGPQEGGVPTGGEGLLLFNQEFRYPIYGALKGVVFWDAGNVFTKVDDVDPFDLRHGVGLGLRFETPIGPLRFEYGRNVDPLPGEGSGEFFLSIGAAF